MPSVARCPGCGGPLDETSVLALAPVCDRCGGVVVEQGGTMGLIGVYGVNDPTITRDRVEADLSVLRKKLANYNGMKESCKDQLTWGLESYARLPPPPELLPVAKVPPFWGETPGAIWGIIAFVWFLALCPAGIVVQIVGWFSATAGLVTAVLALVAALAITVQLIYETVSPHYKAIKANGERPLENARRQDSFEKAYAEALKDAKPKKAAQDHRLRSQIVELEGLEKTVRKIEVEVERKLIQLG